MAAVNGGWRCLTLSFASGSAPTLTRYLTQARWPLPRSVTSQTSAARASTPGRSPRNIAMATLILMLSAAAFVHHRGPLAMRHRHGTLPRPAITTINMVVDDDALDPAKDDPFEIVGVPRTATRQENFGKILRIRFFPLVEQASLSSRAKEGAKKKNLSLNFLWPAGGPCSEVVQGAF